MTTPTLDVQQAANMMKTHPETVLRLIRSKKLKAGKIGRAYCLMTSDVLEYIKRTILEQSGDDQAFETLGSMAPPLSTGRRRRKLPALPDVSALPSLPELGC